MKALLIKVFLFCASFAYVQAAQIKSSPFTKDGEQPQQQQLNYTDYAIRVNLTSITYQEGATFPCDQPNSRCVSILNPTTDYPRYEINVLDNGTAICNERYVIPKGLNEPVEMIYSGICYSDKPVQFLITCRSPPNQPNSNYGWALIEFDQNNFNFTYFNGAFAFPMFLPNSDQNNFVPFKFVPNPPIQVTCPGNGPE